MITSQIEILEQARLYLRSITQEEYVEIISPNFISSAGSHIRHIIDHYQSVISGIESGVIDYDLRLRGSKVEENPQLALNKFDEIEAWMSNLTHSDLNQTISLSTEVSTSTKEIQIVQTSLARELIFVGSHAVHHYAMITQITFAQTTTANTSFGIAPATATYLREKNASA
ncbi:DinB family protein [Pseudocolwellia sp. HL-MZ19]|uniref:DinB family protein n=1 Tax=Pseudocolwellia sp. HL-MZ19 TaxID=3400846 RepID=UPI003CF1529D